VINFPCFVYCLPNSIVVRPYSVPDSWHSLLDKYYSVNDIHRSVFVRPNSTRDRCYYVHNRFYSVNEICHSILARYHSKQILVSRDVVSLVSLI